MKRLLTALGLAFAMTFMLTACEVEQTEEGEMPDVDVSVEGGNLPEYDVDGPDVDVNKKKVTVDVPDVDVTLPNDPDYVDEDPGGGPDVVDDDN